MASQEIDRGRLREYMGRMIGHMTGGAICFAMWLGDELGLYRALADDTSPVFVARGMNTFASLFFDIERIKAAFRGDGAIPWGAHDPHLFLGTEWLFRTGYRAHLAVDWLPLVDGVAARLQTGGAVADVGCGHGASTTLMARAFPDSSFTGSDYHEESIIQARKRIADAGLDGQVRFDVASAQTFDGGPYDLVTSFDCLHDMGDPLGAARHIREMLAPDGTWMVVEPYAGHSVTDNLNPVGRVYYSFSAFLCVPNALSQDGGYSFGAQAGEQPIRRLAADAGYTGFRRVAETPFNIVYELRP